MNSIKNAIVTITLLVVGYGSYVILREPTPPQFVDSRQIQNPVATSPSSAVDIHVPDVLLGTSNANDLSTALAAEPIAAPVGARFEQPRWSNNAPTVAAQSANTQGNLPRFELPRVGQAGPQSSGQNSQPKTANAQLSNVADNLTSGFAAAKDTAAQQFGNAKESLSSRFQQARGIADNAAQSAKTSTNQFGKQVQTFGSNLTAQAKSLGTAAKDKFDASLPPLPTLTQNSNAAKIPELTTQLTPSSPAEASPEQVQFELPKSQFGGLQAKDVVPQKTSIEPPVAALAELNSTIKPPFADKMQSENPFRKSVQVDDSKDKFPHMPRVDEWEPYEGAPLSAEQLANQNAAGNPTFTNNADLSGQPASNSSNLNQPPEQLSSMTVVEPGIVLPADATPMIANEAVTKPQEAGAGLTSANANSNAHGGISNANSDNPALTSNEVTTEPYNLPVANRFQAPATPNSVRQDATFSVTTSEPISGSNSVVDPATSAAAADRFIGAASASPLNTVSNQSQFEARDSNAPTQVKPDSPMTLDANANRSAPPKDLAAGSDLRPAPPVQPAEAKQPSEAFENVWNDVQVLLKKRQYSQALRTLTPWGSESDLSKDQLSRCVRLLDQLAGAIIYSRESYLEPAYTVQAGETLDEVAKQFGVPQQLIAKINGIAAPYALTTGEKLKVIRGPFRAAISLSRSELTLFVGAYYAGRFSIMVGPDLPPEPAFYEVADKSAGRAYFDRKIGREVIQSDDSNRYGKHWLGLRGEHITSGHSVGIHGRSAKYSPADLGSINLVADDAEDVFSILSIGSRVQVLP